MAEFFLRADLAEDSLPGLADPASLLAWGATAADGAEPSQVYRDREGRKTLRLELAGRPYFLKLHRGVGWGEIGKNLLQGRLPVVGAETEYRAIRVLERAGVATLSIAAYASRGLNPARRQSMILTDALVGTVSLETFCADWSERPPAFSLRLRLITCVAMMARNMHEAGVNHRDFYLCHFHLVPDSLAGKTLRCHLLDLHRAQCRSRTPRRWLVKDLAGLYFSAMDCGLTLRDLQRFARHYFPGGLREAVREDAALWRRVHQAAVQLYRKANHGREPPSLLVAGTSGLGR